MLWNGAIETWDRDINTGEFAARSKEYKGELSSPTITTYQWITAERLIYTFKSPGAGPAVMRGRLLSIRDYNTNTVALHWNETIGVITQVVDTVRGVYDFTYNAGGLLTGLAFTNGPSAWLVNFGYDATNRLISQSFTNTSGLYTNVNTQWQFTYNTNGLLERILDPRGFTNTTVQYDQYGRKTNQLDALGRATVTKYGSPGKRQITHVDPGTNSWVETYDRKHRLLSQTDPLGQTTRHTYDAAGNRVSITEPLGWQTFFGYDNRANVIVKTNALGEVWRWSFHPVFNKATNEVNPLGWTNYYVYDAARGNLLRHYDGIGTLVTYTYATNGLALTSTDANGNTSRFTYDTNGFLIARTDPATNTWQFIVNELGWKLSEINPFNDSAQFAYDLNGQLVQTVDPLNRTFTKRRDASGNLLAESDGKGEYTFYTYDAANQRIATTNRMGNTWTSFFTLRGKLDRSMDPLGNASSNYYDSANRLIAVSDAAGNTVSNQYDANGNLTVMIDPVGQRWSKTYDRLNRVVGETDPQGNTKRTTYDPAGRIQQVTSPNGFPSTHEYDGRGRLVKWTDPEKFVWRYDYDGNANITNITDALNGRYVMTYGSRNERRSERNQDGKQWDYTYDALLRLKTQQDPNGTLRTREYDPAGRVTSLSLNTGREDSYDYDDNDNPRVISRRLNGVGAATTRLTYDPLDRVTHVVDPHGVALDYGFDALSRIVTRTYPGNRVLTNRYDAISRLTNQVDWAGRQLQYTYDRAGRLISRTYPNGLIQTNSFDSAGRLTSLSCSPATPNTNALNMALTYAYDRNGNTIGSSERGTFSWPLPAVTDETSRFTAAGRITNRLNVLHPTNNYTYQYDPSGNLTNAAGGGQSWRLTYDEDNRTTSIAWNSGSTNVTIANRYDAMGRRIARQVDGVETRYVLDLSGGMERILCDTTATGQITAYYIHGPDLCYRIDTSNNILCYHADAQANIISVTDGGGTNVAQYAYTPYGRSLGSTNLPSQISNPYRFVGSQGVMEELPGLYFMRARYYSADAGVFLSTDPVKKIGPGWKPMAYGYGNGNPLLWGDPKGETPAHVLAFGGGFFAGMVEGAFEGAYKDILSTIPVGMGLDEEAGNDITEASFELLSAGSTAKKTYKYVRTVIGAGDPSRMVAAATLGEVAGGKAGGAIYGGVKAFLQLYDTHVIQPASEQLRYLLNRQQSPSQTGTTRTSADASGYAANLNSSQGVANNSPAPVSSGTTSGGGGGGSKITIQSGATLSGIAKANGTTVGALLAANPQISNPNVIYAGASLNLPRANPPPGSQNRGNSTGKTTGGRSSNGSSSGGGSRP